MGRHGVCHGASMSSRACAPILGALDRKHATDRFAVAMAPSKCLEQAWVESLDSQQEWSAAIELLQSHGLFASRWASRVASADDNLTMRGRLANAGAPTPLPPA